MMRFLRHLATVMLVVTVIVAGSFVWAHVGGSTSGPTGPVPQAVLVRIGQVKSGRILVRTNDGINFSQYKNLVRTGVIEAALATVVVTIGIARRQYRRAQRVTRGDIRA